MQIIFCLLSLSVLLFLSLNPFFSPSSLFWSFPIVFGVDLSSPIKVTTLAISSWCSKYQKFVSVCSNTHLPFFLLHVMDRHLIFDYCLFWVIFYSHIHCALLRRAVPQSAIILYFISAVTARYLVNVFIYFLFDYTQSTCYYSHGGSFKVLHVFNFYFNTFVFTYFIIFFDWYEKISTDISIRRYDFFSSS